MTTIEWTDVSVNPIRARDREGSRTGWHCEHVTEGCRNCYAEKRNLSPMYGKPFAGTKFKYHPAALKSGAVEVYLDEKVLKKVLGMRKPKRVFWCSMTDIFGHWVADAMLDRCYAVMALTPHLTHIVLTKRPERMKAYLSYEHTPNRVTAGMFDIIKAKGGDQEDWKKKRPDLYDRNGNATIAVQWPLKNVWAGVSVSDQDDADKWVPILLETPAAVRWVSYEPALGGVDFGRWIGKYDCGICGHREIKPKCEEICHSCHLSGMDLGEFCPDCGAQDFSYKCSKCTHYFSYDPPETISLDLIVCGGESGKGARPMHPDYPRKVRDDCVAAGVAFFFKQWGAWQNGSDWSRKTANNINKFVLNDGSMMDGIMEATKEQIDVWSKLNPTSMANVGKKKAGRMLDGRTWDELPGEGVGG